MIFFVRIKKVNFKVGFLMCKKVYDLGVWEVCLCLFLVRSFLWIWIDLGVILISLLLLINLSVCLRDILIGGISVCVLLVFDVWMLVSCLFLSVLIVRLLLWLWILIIIFLYIFILWLMNKWLCFWRLNNVLVRVLLFVFVIRILFLCLLIILFLYGL